MEVSIKQITDFYNEYPECIGSLTVETQFGHKTIQYADITSYDSEVYKVELSNHMSIETSPKHRIMTKSGWKFVSDLSLNDSVLTKNGFSEIRNVKKTSLIEDLYDLQVEEVHEYYANGIVSHNSAIYEALTYNWFGKPYRDIKVSELLSRKNKKNLYTESEFENEKDTYRIIRTMSPNKLQIFKNGNELNSLSSKTLDQEEINNILGVDYNLFKLIIAIAVNYNKPFLALSLPEKRNVVESIFDIKVFGEMLKALKKKTSALKVDKTIYETGIKKLETSIVVLRKQIKEIEDSIKNFDENKEKEYNDILNQIEQITNKIKIDKDHLNVLNGIISSIEIPSDDFYSLESKLVSESMTAQANIKNFNKQISFLNKNSDCPLCGYELTEEHKEKEIKKLEKEILKANKVVDKHEKLIGNVRKNIENKNELEQRKRIVQNELTTLTYSVSSNEKELIRLNSEKEKVANREFNFSINTLKEECERQISEYKEASRASEDIQKKLTINEYAAKMLAEDGIKSYFFKRLIPILNLKINDYLNLFELPVSINFDSTLNDNISINGSSDKNVAYMSFSEGEKKRIDIAILLSFLDTTKIISNWNCNVLIFDEVLDNATDIEGLDKLLGSIKNMVMLDPKLCCYIISHRDASTEHYDRIKSIKKVGGFSKFVTKHNK